MQMIKFIAYPEGLIESNILKETIVSFAHKSGFKIKKLEYNFVDLKQMRSLNTNFLNHKNDTDTVSYTHLTLPTTSMV